MAERAAGCKAFRCVTVGICMNRFVSFMSFARRIISRINVDQLKVFWHFRVATVGAIRATLLFTIGGFSVAHPQMPRARPFSGVKPRAGFGTAGRRAAWRCAA